MNTLTQEQKDNAARALQRAREIIGVLAEKKGPIPWTTPATDDWFRDNADSIMRNLGQTFQTR